MIIFLTLVCLISKIYFTLVLVTSLASLVAQMVKNLLAIQETWVGEDPLEKEKSLYGSS